MLEGAGDGAGAELALVALEQRINALEQRAPYAAGERTAPPPADSNRDILGLPVREISTPGPFLRDTGGNLAGAVDSARHRDGQGAGRRDHGHGSKGRDECRDRRAAVKCGNDYSAQTAGDGTYSMSNVAPGGYSCTTTANRYGPPNRNVTVTSAETTTANFNLARS
jgi:hypothetical protein